MELVASIVVGGGWQSSELVTRKWKSEYVSRGSYVKVVVIEGGCRSLEFVIGVGLAKVIVGVYRRSLLVVVVDGWSY